MDNSNVISDLLINRSSVRNYKEDKNIPEDKLMEILKLAGHAPSSWNLQHWKFILIKEKSNKELIYPITNNQTQILEASAIIVVLGDLEAYKNAEEVYKDAVEAGYMSEEAKNKLIANINHAYDSNENMAVFEAIRNGSLAAMQLMIAAKGQGIDSCPIGGFDTEALVKILNIPSRYIPVLMITLGYAEKPAHPTKRFPIERLILNERF